MSWDRLTHHLQTRGEWTVWQLAGTRGWVRVTGPLSKANAEAAKRRLIRKLKRTLKGDAVMSSLDKAIASVEMRRTHPMKRSSRDASGYLGGAVFEQVDRKGAVHRFRVSHVGSKLVDLEHVATWSPGRGWERGSGDRYPVSVSHLASMRRVRGSGSLRDVRVPRTEPSHAQRSSRRDFNKRYEYVPQGAEAGKGYAASRYAKLIKRHRRHKAYNASTQYQGQGGAGYDQARGRRRKKGRRRGR